MASVTELLPPVSWNFLSSSFFFSLYKTFSFFFSSICFYVPLPNFCSCLVGGSSQRLHYRGIYINVRRCNFHVWSETSFCALGFPHLTLSDSLLLAHLAPLAFALLHPFKKNRARNAERSFFHLLSPSIHLRLEAQVLIEVLQPASPATRRKKCIDRNRLSVPFCTILLLPFPNFFSFFFFFLLLLSFSLSLLFGQSVSFHI